MICKTLISLVLIYLIWLYFKSKNNFFFQSRDVLSEKRQLLIKVLEDRGLSKKEVNHILDCFNLLRDFPSVYKFDGATIVYDLETIKGLDASAMVHDVEYQLLRHRGFKTYFFGKLKADVNYGKLMRKLGITWLTAWSRVLLLIISTPIWMLIIALKGKLN